MKYLAKRQRDLLLRFDRASSAVLTPFARGPLANQDPRRILVLELWGTGDVVLATAAIAGLRQLYAGAEITLLGKAYAATLLQNHPEIHRVIPYAFPWTRFHRKYRVSFSQWREMGALICRLRSERFDLAVDVRGDPRSNLLMKLVGARRRLGYGCNGGAVFLTDALEPDVHHPHRVDEWNKLLAYLGYRGPELGPRLHVSEDERGWARRFLGQHGISAARDRVVGVHLGAGNLVKRWGVREFAEIARWLQRQYGARLVIFPDPDGYGRDIEVPGALLLPTVSLREMMAVFSACQLLLCNDSGPMHIAAGLGVPVAAVFGPTDPALFRPWGEQHRVVIKDVCVHRPCWDRCVYPEPLCIRSVEVSDVIRHLTMLGAALGWNSKTVVL